jgi:hypothetical protein
LPDIEDEDIGDPTEGSDDYVVKALNYLQDA